MQFLLQQAQAGTSHLSRAHLAVLGLIPTTNEGHNNIQDMVEPILAQIHVNIHSHESRNGYMAEAGVNGGRVDV